MVNGHLNFEKIESFLYSDLRGHEIISDQISKISNNNELNSYCNSIRVIFI